MTRVRVLCLVLSGLFVGGGGCGSSVAVAPVEGTLTLDGKPLGQAAVTFILESSGPAAQIRSVGKTDEQGRFQLRSDTGQNGGVIGQHRVIVEDLAMYDAPRDEEGSITKFPRRRFPALYGDPLQTPLRATIEPGPQQIDLLMTIHPTAARP